MNITKFFTLPLGKVKLDLLTIPAFAFSYISGYSDLFFISFFSVLIHEFAHILCARKLNVEISHLEIHPFGVCAALSNPYIGNSEKEFLIAFSGPFTSLFLAMLALFLKFPCFKYFFDINICICAVNLLPALPLDGGRMLKSMLTWKTGILNTYKILQKCGKILIFVSFPLAVLALIKTKFSFSVLLITAFLAGNICKEQNAVTLTAFREFSKQAQKTRHLKRTRLYSASPDEYAEKMLKHISYDYFISVNVVEKGKIIGTLTEEQIIYGISKNGVQITLGEILNTA